MPYKYLKSGDEYFSVGEGSNLQETTEQDIRGRMGDLTPDIYNRFGVQQGDWKGLLNNSDFSGGGIMDADPTQLSVGAGGEALYQGKGFSLAGSQARFKNQATAQAFGISDFKGLPAGGEVQQDLDFANYLKETGQTYNNGQFSGSGAVSGQPGAYKDPNASGSVFTPAQTTNANNTVYKDAQGNVFKADGTPIDQATFQKMGLNISHINTKQALDSRTPGKKEAEKNLGDGATSTSMFGGETSDFFKTIADRFAKTDEMVANILTAGERSEEEKKLKETIGGIQSSFEAGLTDIQGQTIPMALIIGQGAELEKRATDKVKALTRLLDTYKDDREAKYNALVKAYDLSRNSTNDMIALYKLTQPDKLAFDSDTGTVYFHNPMTGEVYQKQIPGFQGSDKLVTDLMAKYPDAGISKTDTYSQAAAKLNSSKIYQDQIRGPEGSSQTEQDKKTIEKFNDSLTSWNGAGTRENFIRMLQAKYPNVNKDDIVRKVYETYPDNYKKAMGI